jgi:hypothetical protein
LNSGDVACGPLQSVHVCTLHKTVLETNSETITTKQQAVNAFIRTCTMDNITVVDLHVPHVAAEAVLQGEKLLSACFSNDS